MPQGKLKVKTKLPPNVKKNHKNGPAATKRSNAPIKPKKQKMKDSQRLHEMVTKALNKTLVAGIEAEANKSNAGLSKAQQAVINYNKNK